MRARSSEQRVEDGAGTREGDGPLRIRLDAPLPRELSVGMGTALFVCGTCIHRDARIRSLSFVVDGAEHPATAHSMPRLDVFRSLHPGLDPYDTAGISSDPRSADDPNLHGYRCGFWGIVRVGPRPPGPCELSVRVRLSDGSEATAPIASPIVTEPPEPRNVESPDPSSEPMVAICMATYQPPLDLFRRQIESIRSQTRENWVCFVSDDCSGPRHLAAIQRELAGDSRFVVSSSERRLGFYLNFERALSMAPDDAEYVALADQDDFWYPEKLERLLGAIGGAQLAYSDSRVVSRDGKLISDTYWSSRRNNHTDLLSLLVANSVTGAASLLRRELLRDALPFPPRQFAHFHDHWLALTALSLGEIAFVEDPLYDYVQHGGATLGHAAANRMLALRERLGLLKQDPRERVRMWRLHYFVDVARLTECATILKMRCGDRMAAHKRRALDRFLRADRSLLAVADLWRRGARELIGTPETLGAEWMLAYAFTWRRLLSATVRERPVRGLRIDAAPPPDLILAPGQESPDNPTVRAIAEKIAPLELAVDEHESVRINVLIPTIDLAHFFGGYIGKFNLAKRLAQDGLRVRIVTVDPVGPLPPRWQRTVESYGGLSGLFDRVEVAFGREARALGVSSSDAFIATTWWTAHIAHRAMRTLGGGKFMYLIQEYEPFTFPMGAYAALAAESYDFPHCALFSTELLRDYFRRHRIGVFSDSVDAGESQSAVFENAITPIEPPTAAALAERGTRGLLFYARPESHANRNMFELGMLALREAVAAGAFRDGWDLHGIGSLQGQRALAVGQGMKMELLPRSDQSSYATLLREHDLGLALMYTPHPSLVPIEMASAGMLTVTNSFENKTQEALTGISTNLLAPRPTIAGIAQALIEASDSIDDYERRVSGSAVNWSRDWSQSFSAELIGRVVAFVER